VELNVATELKLAGRAGHAHISQAAEPFEFNGRTLVFASPLEVEVSYVYDGEGFTVSGSLTTSLVMNCTKCNAEFTQPFTVPFTERFMRISEEEAEELECYTFTGEVLSLDKMVQDLILLNAPMYGLCKPSCKGLCPTCGVNLNNSQCACSSAAGNSAFASLKELAQLLKDE